MLKNKSQILLYEEIRAAVASRRVDAVKAFTASNPALLDEKDTKGKSLLQIAIIFFCPEITLALLCSQKINVNHRDNRGATALASALISANFEAIKLLLQAGATLDTNQRHDRLALAVAIKKNPSIALLLEQAARGQLEPLHSLEDNTRLDTQIQPPDEPPILQVTASEKQEPLTNTSAACFDSPNAKPMFSWHTVSGTLKHRFRNTNQFSSIEMSSNPGLPSQPPSNAHPHAD